MRYIKHFNVKYKIPRLKKNNIIKIKTEKNKSTYQINRTKKHKSPTKVL